MYRQFRSRNNNISYFRNIRNTPINNNMMRNFSSFTVPTIGKAISIPKPTVLFRNAIAATTGTSSKLGLGGILGGISKTITTVNQAMPIINQVKPLFGNVKSAFNFIKGLRNNNSDIKDNVQTTINNKVETEVIDEEKNTKSEEKLQENYQFTPNKPYFS